MKAIFLDRDGVINEYPGSAQYVEKIAEFKFISGSLEGIKKLFDDGFNLFVISNQAGVAKGLYSEGVLNKINRKITSHLAKKKAQLRGIYYCMHHPESGCDCRKPKTGLLKRALDDFGQKPELSFFIGDSFKDMETARRFGAKSVLVLSGREKITNRDNWKFEPDYVFDNLLLAAHYLCLHFGKYAKPAEAS